MNTKPVLNAEDVKKILAAAEAHALQNKWAVTIAVSDDGGHLLGMLRLDDAAPISSHIAPAKAKTCLLYTSPVTLALSFPRCSSYGSACCWCACSVKRRAATSGDRKSVV